MRKFAIATLSVLALVAATPWFAAEAGAKPERQSWTYKGPFGHFDRAQLQRGFKVYKEVCAACHGLKLVSFRNLAEPGGPEFSEAQAKVLAAEYKVKDGPNDQGEMFERDGRLSDRFPSVDANEQAARARFNGALPPDLSVIAKARSYEVGLFGSLLDFFRQYQEHGSDYLYALLTGYEDPPAGVTLGDLQFWNKYFPGNRIAMTQPLQDGQVDYSDGTKNTKEQMAKDVTAFLMWAAEPHLEARKRIGFQVMIFLLIFGALAYFTKKKVWSSVH